MSGVDIGGTMIDEPTDEEPTVAFEEMEESFCFEGILKEVLKVENRS